MNLSLKKFALKMVFHMAVKDVVTYLDKHSTVPNVIAIIDLVPVVVLSLLGSYNVGRILRI